MFDTEFWGEPISIYTDADAQDDGILVDVSDLNVKFNGKTISRATVGAVLATELRSKQPGTAKNNLQFIADHAAKDRETEDAWGIFEPDARLGNEKMWLVGNEIGGYTLMLPSEY